MTELISVGQVITTVGEGAFVGALGSESTVPPSQFDIQLKVGWVDLTSSSARMTGGEIIGNEARQVSQFHLLLQSLSADWVPRTRSFANTPDSTISTP